MIPEEGLKENNGIAGSILLSLPVLKQALNSLLQQKSSDIAEPTVIFLCGEGGIRTLGTSLSSYNGLANRPFRPLRHLSGWAAKIKINACKSQKTNPKFRAFEQNLGFKICCLYRYIAANCTFCCNSSTFSLNTPSVSIRSFTVWQE